MTFRDHLLATIRAARPVLASTGALIVGSEVPNLLQPGAASTRAPDLEELVSSYRLLRTDLRHAVRSNLTILSLLEAREGMPDPRLHRHTVSDLLGHLDAAETGR